MKFSFVRIIRLSLLFISCSPVFSQSVFNFNGTKTIIGNQSSPGNHEGDVGVQFLPNYNFSAYSSGSMHAYTRNSITESANPPRSPLSFNEFESRTIDTDLPVGRTEGQSSVSLTGAANYNIPIILPKGTNGLQPNLSIFYNSQSGDGMLGKGWNISGLPIISRVPKTAYHDNNKRAVQLTTFDAFALDGNRLILRSGSSGYSNSTYTTENETFSLITAHGKEGLGPQWFEVQTKDGSIIEFGKTSDSKLKGTYSSNIFWRANRMIDVNGNYLNFIYTNEGRDSRILKIKYTGNINTGLTPYNEITFDYIKRADDNSAYVVNSELGTKYLLEKINISTLENTFKTYTFKYGYDNASYLTEIIEGEKAGQKHLNSTIFKYGTNNTPFEKISTIPVTQGGQFTSGDFNGDGKTDLVHFIGGLKDAFGNFFHHQYKYYNSTGNIFSLKEYKALNFETYNSHGKEIPKNVTKTSADFNGDGLDDILLVDNQYHSIYQQTDRLRIMYSTGTGFDIKQIYSMGSSKQAFPSSQMVHTGDFDGDGATDILTVACENIGTNTYPNFTNYQVKIYYPKLGQTHNITTINALDLLQAHDIRVLDYNGDGKQDIMIIPDYDKTSINETKIYCLPVGSLHHFQLKYNKQFPTKWHTTYTGDFNGDGKTDILAAPSNDLSKWTVAISSGTDGYFHNRTVTLGKTFDPASSFLFVIDVNNDGKTDLVHQYNTYPNNFVDIQYSTGNKFSSVERHQVLNHFGCWGSKVCAKTIGDYNGDGNLDIIGTGNVNSNSYILRFNVNATNQVLTKIKDGFNQVSEFEYVPLPQKTDYDKGNNKTSSIIGFIAPLKVVSKTFTPDGLGGRKETEHGYSHGFYHTEGKGFLGFDFVFAVTPSTGEYKKQSFELNTTYNVLAPVYDVLTRNYKRIYSNSYTYNFIPNNGAYQLRLAKSSIIKYQLNNVIKSTTNSDFNYDDFGNITSSIINIGNETITTNNEYITKASGIPNKLTKQTITTKRGAEASYTRTINHEYDNLGRMKKIITDLGQEKAVTKEYLYDSYGNIFQLKILPSGMNPITTQNYYDNRGRNLTKKINPLGQISETWYDETLSKPIKTRSITDFYTYYKYDSWGKIVETKDSKYLQKNTSYDWALLNYGSGAKTPTTTTFKVTTTGNGSPTKTAWMDALGRTVKSASEGMRETSYIVNKYNLKGEHISTTEPFWENSPEVLLTTSTYGSMGELTSTSTGEFTTTFSYPTITNGGSRITTTKPGNIINTITYDETGKVITSTGASGTLTYTYYSNGLLKEVKNGYNVLTKMEYDLYGNQTKLIDADAGTTIYNYDALGNLISQTDANGNQQTMIYDTFGRLKLKTIAEGTSTYDYYSTGNGLNQLKEVLGFNGYNENYEYDKYGRITEKKETIDQQVFSTQYKYDYTDRLIETIYPSGYIVKNIFDPKGFLAAVTDASGLVLYNSPEYNAKGQLTNYTLGNGLSTEKKYDNYGRLTDSKSSNNLFHQRLVYKQNTSLIEQSNRRDKSLIEELHYDNQERLIKTIPVDASSGTWVFRDNIKTSFNNSGNIISKSDAGIYNYGTQKPHAVLSISNATNNISANEQNITYTSFDRTKTISENGWNQTFHYNSAYNRKKSVFSAPYYGRIRYYIGNYEKTIAPHTNLEVHYIPAGDGVCAMHVISNGVGTTYYVYKDHLGSFNTITDNNGNVITEQSFDAWGRERNPNNLTYSVPGGKPAWLYRGYTGHEMLNDFKLINMNNRLYDPLLGRMLAVDNIVQSPYSVGSYNRYTYANNNPLSHIDPNGEEPITVIAGLVIGAYLGGTISNGGELNPTQWNWKSGNTYTGIIIGGAFGALGGYYIGAAIQGTSALSISTAAGINGVGSVGAVWSGTDGFQELQWSTNAGGEGKFYLYSTEEEWVTRKGPPEIDDLTATDIFMNLTTEAHKKGYQFREFESDREKLTLQKRVFYALEYNRKEFIRERDFLIENQYTYKYPEDYSANAKSMQRDYEFRKRKTLGVFLIPEDAQRYYQDAVEYYNTIERGYDLNYNSIPRTIMLNAK